jgi:Flp pilus assembly protein TadD
MYDKAVGEFSEAIRVAPRDARAYHARGAVYAERGGYQKAIKDFSEAIRIAPKKPNGYKGRGYAYAARKQYELAIEDYSEAIRMDPKNPGAYRDRACVFEAKKDYERAIKDYTEAIRISPKNPGVCNDLAWLLATCPKDDVRDGKRAVGFAMKACELTGWKDSNRLDSLAAAHAECGDFGQAVRRQKEAVELGFAEKEVMDRARKRLKLYQAGKPYREE